MNNTHRIHHLVAGKAAVGDVINGAKGTEIFNQFFVLMGKDSLPIAGTAPLTPGTKAKLLHYITQVIGNEINTAQVIVKQVVGSLGLQFVIPLEQCFDSTA